MTFTSNREPGGGSSDRSGSEPPDGPEPPDQPASDSWVAFLRELPVLLLVAFTLAFLLRTFAVQVFYIPSGSMTPTLEVNDRIIVEKVTYRFRQPRRGEIVVFEGNGPTAPEPTTPAGRVLRGVGQFVGVVPANARDFVKRVIGLPGDRVVIDAGRVRVNGEPVDEPYVATEDDDSYGPFEVPEGKLFVLGDNRPNSSDSRFGLGYVGIDRVVGRAVLIIWPMGRVEPLGAAGSLSVPDDPPKAAPPRAPPVVVPAAPAPARAADRASGAGGA